MPYRRLFPVLALLSAVTLACGQVVEPEGFTLPPSTAPAEAASGASSVSAPEVEGAELEVGIAQPSFVPQRSDGYLPEVLIRHQRRPACGGDRK